MTEDMTEIGFEKRCRADGDALASLTGSNARHLSDTTSAA